MKRLAFAGITTGVAVGLIALAVQAGNAEPKRDEAPSDCPILTSKAVISAGATEINIPATDVYEVKSDRAASEGDVRRLNGKVLFKLSGMWVVTESATIEAGPDKSTIIHMRNAIISSSCAAHSKVAL